MLRTAIASVVLTVILGATAASAGAYHLRHEIKIAGDGGWDYLAFDAPGGRLFVSHGTRVEVLDARKWTPLGAIEDTPGVHGVAFAPALGRGYVSAGASGSIVVFDLKTLARITEIKTTGDNPDAILFEPNTQRVFTFNGRGRNVTVVDARSNSVIGTIDVNAKPEFAVDDGKGLIYVNLEDRNSLAVIDARSLNLIETWPLAGCEEPSGLALDRKNRRLFSVCANRQMIVLDAHDGRQVAQLPIGAGVDGAGYDGIARLAFASCGEGTLTVIKEVAPDKFTVQGAITTKPGARTMAVDERAHRVFLSRADRGADARAHRGAAAAARARDSGHLRSAGGRALISHQ